MMRPSRSWSAVASALALAAVAPATAHATGFTDLGQDIAARTETAVVLDGYLRMRGESLYNFDLDRGLDPSGAPLFPVPLADPTAQTLTHADMRLRTDVAIYAPGGGVAIKLRLDVLDNLVAGSAPAGPPAAATGQEPPEQALRIKRAYGEALTPVGVVVAGRVGSSWGLGLLANGGDCADCDGGDAADRLGFVTPLFGHIWAIAYDFSGVGPDTPRKDGARTVDLDPSDDARTMTFAVLRWRNDLARARRLRAGKATVEYGAWVSHRWQDNDVPASYLPVARPVAITPSQVMARGFSATAFDAWFRLTMPSFRLEAEAALMLAHVDQPSLIPGVLLPEPVESTAFGGAIESEVGGEGATFVAGLDLGFASGDPAPGFGAYASVTGGAAAPGDLEGAQAVPPYDYRVDNFRFHPDYHVDRILFREIIGTVTDAIYVRPHVTWRLGRVGRGRLDASLAVIASSAVEANSTPSGEAALGVEIDPTIAYESDDGFVLAFEQATLLPLAGLDNPVAGLPAEPAQLWRVRVAYVF